MPTAEETEAALAAIEAGFPSEALVIRRRLNDIAEERPMHAWLREVVEAIHASSSSTTQMRETLDKLVPGVSETSKYVSGIYEEEKKRTTLLADEYKQKHQIQLHEADTWRTLVSGAVTMGTDMVKHPVFWVTVSAIVTWFATAYGLPIPETNP